MVLLLIFSSLSCFAQQITKSESLYKESISVELDKILNGEIGKNLIEFEKSFYYPAIKITKGNSTTPGMFGTKIGEGFLYLKKGTSEGYDLYFPVGSGNITGIAVSQADGTDKMFTIMTSTRVKFKDLKEKVEYNKLEYPDGEKDNFKQQIIYNGKDGNTVRFSYREYINELARPAFTQELQYDLADGNLIGFKGLRLEIMKLSNVGIEYKILSNFSN